MCLSFGVDHLIMSLICQKPNLCSMTVQIQMHTRDVGASGKGTTGGDEKGVDE
ncbi:hypothetical protein LINPERPRIM_LOCUS7908, partial [Linum perenne]